MQKQTETKSVEIFRVNVADAILDGLPVKPSVFTSKGIQIRTLPDLLIIGLKEYVEVHKEEFFHFWVCFDGAPTAFEICDFQCKVSECGTFEKCVQEYLSCIFEYIRWGEFVRASKL